MLRLEQIMSQLDEAMEVNTSQTDFSRDYYLDLVNQQRALHLRNEQNKGVRTFDDTVVQTLCIEMERVSRIHCAGIELSDCLILRSKVKIPDTIELHNRDGILSIGSPDIIKKRISHVDYSTIPDRGYNKFSKKELFSFLMDGYLYLYSMDNQYQGVKYVMLRGVFTDPTEAENFSDPNGTSCFNRLTDDYPMSSWMWESLVKPGVLQQLLREWAMPKDLENDSKDEETRISK